MRLIDADEIRIKPEYMHDICGSAMIRVEDVARIINEMPTINPQKWISCDERLPKYGQVVLWCNKYGSVFTSAITARCGDSWAIGKKHRSAKVLAWMPLPEPWKEGNNEVE